MNSISPVPVYDATAVASLLGVEYTAEQLATFGPPPEPLEGFITFFDPGRSFVRLRDAVAGKGTIFCSQSWYDTQPFAQGEAQPRYRQVRSEPLPGSFDKAFADQAALVRDGQEVPPARVVAAAAVIHFLASQQRLFLDCYVRTADRVSAGYCVIVGSLGCGGLGLLSYWNDNHDVRLGLAVSRKF